MRSSKETESGNSDRAILLEQWAKEFRTPLLRFFLRRVPAGTDAEDLVQEVFVRLARHRDLESIRRIEGYLFQTAANVISDQYRKSARTPPADEIFDESSHGQEDLTPERVYKDRKALGDLIRGLYELPERTRHIFVLYHFENVRQTEIAAQFGMPISTVEKHMARANKKLIERLRR